ncbi:MAG TPA: polysaccharide biosynthesis C-terminal domain-containing protein [Streptosporangiaceae bacterium]|jgi:O-antigen/teichoic acid export membrane protein
MTADQPGVAGQQAGGGQRPGGGKGDGKSGLAGVARGGTMNLAGAAVAAISTLGVTVLVTRHFSKYAAGSFFTATSAFLIVEMIGTLGAHNGLVYFIARFRSLDEDDRIPAVLRAALTPVIVASVALMIAMLVFANPLAHVLLNYHQGSGSTAGSTDGVNVIEVALRGLAFLVPFATLENAVLGASRGYREMRPTVIIDRVGVSIAQLAAVLAAAFSGSVALLAPLWALPYLPATIIGWVWLRRIQRDAPSHPGDALPDVPPELAALLALATPEPGSRPAQPARPRWETLGRVARKRLAGATRQDFWRFTTPRAVATVVSTIIQRVDIVIIAIMKGPVEAAVYTAATRFLVLGQFAGTAIARSSQPRLTELFTVRDRHGTNVVYQATTAWLVLLTFPIYLLVLVYGSQALAIFGHSYRAGYPVMAVLCVAMLAGALTGQVDIVLITSGKSSWSMLNGLLVLVTNVGLDLWLIPRHGILGAAIAWAVAITVSNVVPMIQLASVFRLQPISRGVIIAVLLTVVSFLAVPLAIRTALGSSWLSLAAAAIAASLVLAAGVLRFRGPLKLQGVARLPGMRGRRPGRR